MNKSENGRSIKLGYILKRLKFNRKWIPIKTIEIYVQYYKKAMTCIDKDDLSNGNCNYVK